VRGFAKILIIYSAERAGIDMLRVVHGARDLDALDLDAPCCSFFASSPPWLCARSKMAQYTRKVPRFSWIASPFTNTRTPCISTSATP
jgi:hypothetical protein